MIVTVYLTLEKDIKKGYLSQTANLLLTLNLILWKTQYKDTDFRLISKFIGQNGVSYNMV